MLFASHGVVVPPAIAQILGIVLPVAELKPLTEVIEQVVKTTRSIGAVPKPPTPMLVMVPEPPRPKPAQPIPLSDFERKFSYWWTFVSAVYKGISEYNLDDLRVPIPELFSNQAIWYQMTRSHWDTFFSVMETLEKQGDYLVGNQVAGKVFTGAPLDLVVGFYFHCDYLADILDSLKGIGKQKPLTSKTWVKISTLLAVATALGNRLPQQDEQN